MKKQIWIPIQAMIAAIYVVLVYVFQFLSFSQIQFRIAELLLILIFFDKKNAIGLILGTFLANWFFSPFGWIDVMVGTFASVVAIGLMMLFVKKPFIALIFPAVANGIIVGLMIVYFEGLPVLSWVSLGIMGFVFLGEAVVMYALGLPVYLNLRRNEHFLSLFSTHLYEEA